MRFLCVLCLILLLSCSRSGGQHGTEKRTVDHNPVSPSGGGFPFANEDLPDLAETLERLAQQIADNSGFGEYMAAVFKDAEIPESVSVRITESLSESPAFILDFLGCLQNEPSLRKLVDKQHSLNEPSVSYEPGDLVELKNGSYRTGRAGLMLRKTAADALDEMAAAAAAQGITLTASSAYRSYRYQTEVYNRNVREMGQEAADRESARPGFSQHQTGLVVDFGSIDDSFAETAAGKWMAANASRFGWSISFPKGYETVTGYRWESWHYRYVGKDLAAFIDNYFDGVQQYALRFMHEWESRTRLQEYAGADTGTPADPAK